ncbi:MAG TPA: rhomboid family intramembrane serine protease [Puia sp.]|nr:rhomboid family intramembrane serine protease [Puia sp.]
MTEFRPGRFQMIPPVIKNLVIINVLVFLAQNTFGNTAAFNMNNLFALHDIHSEYFRPHQLITHLFMHGGLDHIFFNMFALWMFGSILENYWGPKRFLIFYMACGLGAAFLHLAVLYYENGQLLQVFNSLDPMRQQEEGPVVYGQINEATIGASGAVFGCLAAFGYLFPNSLIYLYFFVPIKAKWLVLAYGAMELYLGVRNSGGDNVAHWAHIGGAIVGLLMVIYWKRTDRRNFY